MQHLLPNTTLQGGKYRIVRILGQGNFGITYLAEQLNPKRTVAIKELFLSVQGVNDRLGSSVIVPNIRNKQMFEQQITKFKKEAKRIMSLHNEHIVPVYDLFDENDTAYYVMEYVEGESLADKMKAMGHPFSIDEVQNIFPQILDALTEIHSHQILHLDIKPGNIMIDCNGLVKLIDFGASKQLTSEETALTGFYFTRGYAPSEQTGMLFNKFGPWTDIYAVGATMYNLLTSKSPTQFDIEEFNPNEIPEDDLGIMYLLIDWMMQPKRQDRPQQAVDVKQRYYIELVKIGILSIISERLDRQVTKTTGEDIDLQKDLHASTTQCNAIQKDIEDTFGVDVTDVPLTFDYLVVTVLTALGLYVLDEEGGDDEGTIFERTPHQDANAPRTISVNNHDAVDLGLSVLWATVDIGASSEKDSGDAFLWGDPDGGRNQNVKESSWSRLFSGGPKINNICGNAQYDTATCLWGKDWRMPTGREFQELAEKCTWEVEDDDHVRLTGPNGKSILLDRNVHWTGEKPFGYVTLFVWGYQQNDVKWRLLTNRDLGKSYTELYLQIRPVCEKRV